MAMRSVDADGSHRVELVATGEGTLRLRFAEPAAPAPSPARDDRDDALIAANRARIAELRTRRVGTPASLGDIVLTREGGLILGKLAWALVASVAGATLARSGVVPGVSSPVRSVATLAGLGLFCTCTFSLLAALLAAFGLAIARASRRLARWAAADRPLAPAFRIASGFAATTGVAVLFVGAYWSLPPL
jgi:hypothetical protein